MERKKLNLPFKEGDIVTCYLPDNYVQKGLSYRVESIYYEEQFKPQSRHRYDMYVRDVKKGLCWHTNSYRFFGKDTKISPEHVHTDGLTLKQVLKQYVELFEHLKL